jgi:tetratricopeptide (TPR) repeat protein
MENDNYAFNHALTQQALYAQLPPRRRRRLHLAAGEALERLPEKERGQRSSELARHFLEADEPERALPHVVVVGEQAEALFAFGEAERHYRTALDLARAVGDERRSAEALERLGGVLGNVGRYREALETLEEAARLDRARGDPEGEGRVVARIGFTHCLRGRADEGLARIQPLIVELTSLGPSFALAKLHETLVAVMYHLNKHDEQLAAADREAEIARSIGDEQLFAAALAAQAWALLNLGRRDEMIQTAAQAIPLLEAAGDLVNLSWALGWTGDAHANRGELAAARTFQERALVVAEQIGEPLAIVEHLNELGWIELSTGNWGQAHAYAERADATLRPVEVSVASGAPLLLEGNVSLVEGGWDEAEEQLTQVAELARRNENHGFLLGAQYGLATLDLWKGHPEGTLSSLEPMLVGAADDERIPIFPLLAEAHLAMGNQARTEELVTRATEWGRAELKRFTWADALRVQGLLRTAQGRREEAHHAFADALALTQFMGTPWYESRILEAESVMHAQAGEPQQARRCLEEALTIFQRLGARKDVERTKQALARLG